ncbi:hypothetical protein ACWD25_60505 [Streptomyces sp. NPDC002920]
MRDALVFRDRRRCLRDLHGSGDVHAGGDGRGHGGLGRPRRRARKRQGGGRQRGERLAETPMTRTWRSRDVTLYNGPHGGPGVVHAADERSGGDGARYLACGRAGARRGKRERGRVPYRRRPVDDRRFGSLDDAALLVLPRTRVGRGWSGTWSQSPCP